MPLAPRFWIIALVATGFGLHTQEARAAYITAAGLLDVSGSTPAEKQAIAAIGGNFIVTNTTRQPTGTGVLNPFVRIQQKGDEEGYNTSDGSPLDDKAGIWTHDLRFSAVQAAVNIGGTAYREFILDVNQDHNGPLSLNQIQIFQSTSPPGATGTASAADSTHNALLTFNPLVTPGVIEVFRMNNQAVSPSNLEIWALTDSGSGSGDMYLYVKESLFVQDPDSYITLYSQFGKPNGKYASSAGFEEWAVDPPAPVPAPPTVLLIAAGVPALGLRRLVRRKRAKA